MDPPPVGFPRGKFDRDLMDEIIGLWKRLKPKVKAGGRGQMDAIELRATIFSIRANLDYVRSRRYFYRCLRSEDKVVFRLDDESFDQLNIKSKRVIQTLERHVKRANRTLLKAVSRDAYELLMNAWRNHLRWMRLRIAYFKPLRGIRGRKVQQQKMLDELMQMAQVAIENDGFEQPEPSELWRIMRLYASSARRCREGIHNIHYMLRNKHLAEPRVYLVDFILKRLKLKELSKS